MIEQMIGLISTILLIGLGYSAGGFRERRHMRELDAREAASRDIVVTNLRTITNPDSVREARLVTGNVVIATDYYKTIATMLRNLIGGEMRAAQTLMTRARREALMRMVDEARAMGASEVWNVRYQFCNVSSMSGRSKAMSVELYAYGTAIVRQPTTTAAIASI